MKFKKRGILKQWPWDTGDHGRQFTRKGWEGGCDGLASENCAQELKVRVSMFGSFSSNIQLLKHRLRELDLLWMRFFKTSGEEEGTRKELREYIIETLE